MRKRVFSGRALAPRLWSEARISDLRGLCARTPQSRFTPGTGIPMTQPTLSVESPKTPIRADRGTSKSSLSQVIVNLNQREG